MNKPTNPTGADKNRSSEGEIAPKPHLIFLLLKASSFTILKKKINLKQNKRYFIKQNYLFSTIIRTTPTPRIEFGHFIQKFHVFILQKHQLLFQAIIFLPQRLLIPCLSTLPSKNLIIHFSKGNPGIKSDEWRLSRKNKRTS